MTAVIARRRSGVSIRALMISVALCALILTPFVLLYRRAQAERERAVMAVAEAARTQAEIAATQRAATLAAQSPFNNSNATSTHPTITGSQASSPTSLWAALTVNHPLFEQGHTKDLTIEFNLVNDGNKVIEPRIQDSVIVVNGDELADSSSMLGRGSKNSRFQSLPPGGHLQFSCALGDRFDKPGIYGVSWKGTGFQSPEIKIRILPRRTD